MERRLRSTQNARNHIPDQAAGFSIAISSTRNTNSAYLGREKPLANAACEILIVPWIELALGVLRCLAGALQTRLLALFHTRIARKQAGFLKHRAQFCIHI